MHRAQAVQRFSFFLLAIVIRGRCKNTGKIHYPCTIYVPQHLPSPSIYIYRETRCEIEPNPTLPWTPLSKPVILKTPNNAEVKKIAQNNQGSGANFSTNYFCNRRMRTFFNEFAETSGLYANTKKQLIYREKQYNMGLSTPKNTPNFSVDTQSTLDPQNTPESTPKYPKTPNPHEQLSRVCKSLRTHFVYCANFSRFSRFRTDRTESWK